MAKQQKCSIYVKYSIQKKKIKIYLRANCRKNLIQLEIIGILNEIELKIMIQICKFQ